MVSITVIWLLMDLAVSFPLCFAIAQFISNKTLVSVSLVDLLYRDAIIYLYLLCCTGSAGFIHCLLKEETLSLTASAAYAGCVVFFVDDLCISLTLSGGIRLLSLLRNSEVRLLGPENEAIVIIRIFSILFSTTFQVVMIFGFNTNSGLFHMYHEEETRSNLIEAQSNKFKMIYLICPVLTTIVNATLQLFIFKLRKKLNQVAPIFLVEPIQVIPTQPFSLSVWSVIGFPLVILFSVFSSFLPRQNRLVFIYPIQITTLSVVLPLLIINNNKALKHYFVTNYIRPITDNLELCYCSVFRTITTLIGKEP